MNRKEFLVKSFISGIAAIFFPGILKATNKKAKLSAQKEITDQVGFNHLPNKEYKTMKTIVHKAETRGHANHGWLDSHHTFSFANYYNPERVHFGALRVLNDDIVAGGQGFGTHPHENMEIISIPLEGDLEHKDSMGNIAVIKEGDVQVMSAGTGVYHSEYNKNTDKEVKFLQIWLFPKEKQVTPRYDQISLKDIEERNQFYQILSPNDNEKGVWIHQDAWFHLGKFDAETATQYQFKKTGNGVYAFVVDGSVEINGQDLNKRDGMGLWDINELDIKARKGSKVLLMEVPM